MILLTEEEEEEEEAGWLPELLRKFHTWQNVLHSVETELQLVSRAARSLVTVVTELSWLVTYKMGRKLTKIVRFKYVFHSSNAIDIRKL
jgi:hypothetical protein